MILDSEVVDDDAFDVLVFPHCRRVKSEVFLRRPFDLRHRDADLNVVTELCLRLFLVLKDLVFPRAEGILERIHVEVRLQDLRKSSNGFGL